MSGNRSAMGSHIGRARALRRASLGLWLVLVLGVPSASAQVRFSPPTNFPTGDAPTDLAVGDFNRDADADLAVVNVTPDDVSVLLGGVGSAFSAPTPFDATSAPAAVGIGDFNGDADPDLAVPGANGVAILLGTAGGGFSPQTLFPAGGAPSSVAVADFNGDLAPDLAVANRVAGTVSVLLGAGGGTFSEPTTFTAGDAASGALSVSVGEFDGDGDPDLAVANSETDNVSVLLGAAGGTFSAPTNFAAGNFPDHVTVADFNGDGDPDLAVSNRLSNNVSVLLGGAGGTFSAPTSFAVGNAPMWVAAGDLDGDGDPDLVTANRDANTISVLFGGPAGTFSAPIAYPAGNGPLSVSLADFDGDGDRDVAVANGFSDDVSVLSNRGRPGTPPPTRTTPPAPQGGGPLPAPVLGRTANVAPLRGRVLVALPKGARGAGTGRVGAVKGLRFVPLREARQIPVGSFLDTRRGSVRLTSAADFSGKTQAGAFASGIFQIRQARRARAVTELRLDGGSFRRCGARGSRVGASGAAHLLPFMSGETARAAARRRAGRRTIRRLRANAKGRFRTRGRYSAATVRGTEWLTQDRCDGTLTRVKRGRVAVRDPRRRKTIVLRAGKSYLARAHR